MTAERVSLGKRDRVLADRPLNANSDEGQSTDHRSQAEAQKRRKLTDQAGDYTA